MISIISSIHGISGIIIMTVMSVCLTIMCITHRKNFAVFD